MKKLFTLLTCMSFLSLANFISAQEASAELPQNLTEKKSEPLEFTTDETLEEEKETGLFISGSLDVYYRASLGTDVDAAPATSFANLPGFSLGMANLIISHTGKKVGITGDFVFGPRGEDATFLSPFLRPGGTSSIINQLYANWNVSDKVTLTLGNFNTFLGYEVISPVDNFNYSTSYMFSYGPFSHTGIKADITLAEGITLMAGIFNPTDATEFNPTNEYVGGIQFGYEKGKLGSWLNFLFDDEFFQVDLATGFDVTESFYLGLNATSATDNFYGAALYAQVEVSDPIKLGIRAEYFSDQGVGAIEFKENV